MRREVDRRPGHAGVRSRIAQGHSTSRSGTARSWLLSPVWGILARAMARSRKTLTKKAAPVKLAGYERLFAEVAEFIEEARRSAARSVNAVMTATYWLVGRR